MQSKIVHWLKPLVGLTISIGFIVLLVQGIEIESLSQALTDLSIPFILLAMSFLAVGYFFRIIRWWWMLRTLEPDLPFKACIWPFLTSIAVNNILPFRAGDALRVFGFQQQLRSPAVRVLGTLIIERILDLVVLLVFLYVGFLGLPPMSFPEKFILAVTWLAGISVTVVFVLIFFASKLEQVVHRIATHNFCTKRNWSKAIIQNSSHFIEGLGLVNSLPRLLTLLGLSFFVWIFEGAVFATVLASIYTDISPLGSWFSLATGTLATLIPSSPGYVGTFDYFTAKGLVAYGAPPDISVAYALAVHAVLWLPLTAVGMLYLILHGKKFWAIKTSPPSTRI